jgi:hypothetical protein
VEGNGNGVLPTGKPCADGVVRNWRPNQSTDPAVYRGVMLIRFREEDYA